MAWKIAIAATVEKQLSKLDQGVRDKIERYLTEVAQLENPADRGHPLSGPLAGLHRYRVGQLRIVVNIERHIITVTVIAIGRRDSVY